MQKIGAVRRHLCQIFFGRKYKKELRVVFIALAFLLSIYQPQAQAREKLVLNTFPDSDTPNIVFARTIISEAYRRLGIDIEVQYLPGRRAVSQANKGEVAGLLFHVPNLDLTHTNLVQIKVPVFHSELVAFVKDERFQINDWDQLKKYRIGFVRGFLLVEERTKGAQVEMFNEQEEMMLMLSHGKIDVAIDTYLTGRFAIKKLGLKGLRRLEPQLEIFSSFHYLHKRHKELVPKVEAVLLAMEKEGVLRDVRNTIQEGLMGEN